MKTWLFIKIPLLLAVLLGVGLLVLNRPNHPATHPPQTARLGTVGPAVDLGRKIPIEASRWYQVVNAETGLDALFDGETQVNVNTGWNKLLPTYEAYYPLHEGETMTIDRIRLYDFADQNLDKPFTLSIITADWKRIPVARFVGDKYQQWVGPDPVQPDEFRLKKPVSGARDRKSVV